MNIFPTNTAKTLSRTAGIPELFEDGNKHQIALGEFQRMALAGDLEQCMRVFVPYLDKSLNEQHKQVLSLIHELAKKEALSLAIEGLVEVVSKSRSAKDRVSAGAMVNQLFGESKLVDDASLTEKLVVNLVGKGN